MFEKLKEYKATYGNCLVPKRYKDNPKLGTWVDTQRVQYKKLQKKASEKAPQSNESPNSKVPTEQLEQTQNGISAGGGSNSPTVNPVDGKPAAAPKALVGRLTEDRIRRLEEIGFVWSLRDDWQKHYDELKAFKEKNGHCNVPARYAANRRLGIWYVFFRICLPCYLLHARAILTIVFILFRTLQGVCSTATIQKLEPNELCNSSSLCPSHSRKNCSLEPDWVHMDHSIP